MDCSEITTESEHTYCKLISYYNQYRSRGQEVNLHPNLGFCYLLKILQLAVSAIFKLCKNVLFEFLALDKFNLYIFYMCSSNNDCI